MPTAQDALRNLLDHKVKGNKDGKWDISITHERVDAVLEVNRACFDLLTNGDMSIKAYYNGEARDCDGWLLRLLDANLSGVRITYFSDGYFTAEGFLSKLGYFVEGEKPDIEDGYVENCFPPKKTTGDFAVIPVKVTGTLHKKKGKK